LIVVLIRVVFCYSVSKKSVCPLPASGYPLA